ncbi:MAG: hypothetical protein LBJ14_11205 [Desulfarculales bacterium]|jgi:hypothetical protein|nr:hypothetical protein [Desulfarculales bacterium]
MLVENIPLSLRNTIECLELPIYIKLADGACFPPPRLALGDTLMALGLLRNHGRPVRLYLSPSPEILPLLEAHPLVKEIVPPESGQGYELQEIGVARSGRPATWYARTVFSLKLGVLPVDRVRANPILAHSAYYRLARRDDWPSVMVDPGADRLSSLLSRQKPNLLVFPLNPGRGDFFWQDEAWWRELFSSLRPHFTLLAVGSRDYGSLASCLDAVLPMDDPASTLPNLAWLMTKASAFVGRDGGLAHLASALNRRVVTVWDSMASYRYWAGSRGHHLLFSNPYLFRYPQAGRMEEEDLRRHGRVNYINAQGQAVSVDMPVACAQSFARKAEEVFGGIANLAALLLSQREQMHERASVRAWMNGEQRREYYQQSLQWTLRAVKGELPAGENWVVPGGAL